MRRRLPLLLLLSLLLLPVAARAAGKVSLLPTFNLMGEWTDNFLLTPESVADEKFAAYSVTFEPGLRLRYDTFRHEAFIGIAAGFRHVIDHEQYDGWPEFYTGGLGWSYWVTPTLRTTVGDEIIYTTDPRDQPFSQSTTLESLRTESIANRLFATTTWNLSRTSVLEGGYSFYTTEFKEPSFFDTVEHQFNLTWTKQFDPSYAFLTFYDYNRALYSQHFDFLRHYWDHDYSMDPSFPVRMENRADFDTHTPGVGLRYTATPSLSFETRSGVILPAVERNGAYQLDDLQWFQRMDIVKLFWRMQASASYQRNYAPAHGLEGAVLAQSVTARLDERWTRHIETYEEAGYTNYLQTVTDIDAWRATGAFNYYFFNWLGLGAAYNYLEQQSHPVAEGNGDRIVAHRITLRLALTSPRPDWLSF